MDAIERRISNLESLLAHSEGLTEQKSTVCASVTSSQYQLNSALDNKEKLKQLLTNVKVDDYLLDPNYLADVSLPCDAKLKLIELSEGQIRQWADQLEELKPMETLLGSEHIRNAPDLFDKLHTIGLKQAEQTETVQSHTTEVSQLVADYNSLIASLSQQFIRWDQLLTQLEAKQNRT